MTRSLIDSERAKYEKVWSIDEARSYVPSWDLLPVFYRWIGFEAGQKHSVTDWGCGTGDASWQMWLDGWFPVQRVDIAHNAPNRRDDGIDFVVAPIHEAEVYKTTHGFCTEVMEHIHEELIDPTLEKIFDTSPIVFFSIARFADGFGKKYDTGPLHVTVHDEDWWAKRLEKYGHIERMATVRIQRSVPACFLVKT